MNSAHLCVLQAPAQLTEYRQQRWWPTAPAASLRRASHSDLHSARAPLGGASSGRVVTRLSALQLCDEATAVDDSCRVELESIESGCYTVKGSFESTLSTDAVWDVITNYEKLASVYSNIEASTAEVRGDQLQLLQDCRWQFLMFSGSFRTRLAVHEDPQQQRLTFSLLEASFMRDFEGQWQVAPALMIVLY
ncbi:hypothetical protein WJX73_002249 [Symbiochloris irregularis]|uniref:Uncharacterized protein n=1 Tax=Symbiochloris irregularis TaxID=706552 RepID=A0AAW1PI98_9CHLO